MQLYQLPKGMESPPSPTRLTVNDGIDLLNQLLDRSRVGESDGFAVFATMLLGSLIIAQAIALEDIDQDQFSDLTKINDDSEISLANIPKAA